MGNSSLARAIVAFAVYGAVAAVVLPAKAADIVGTMTANYLQQCRSNRTACQDFTNEVLQVLNTAARLGQPLVYKGCAPWPLNPADTGKLVEWILARPQAATGYAADDIATAAEALWPCK